MSVRGAESMFHASKNVFLIIWIFFNNIHQKKRGQKKIKIHTRWGSRARLNALLTIAACRDFAERVRSMCTQLSLIWSFLFLFRFYIIFFVFCFSSFFVFLIFGGFYIVSLSSLSLPLLVLYANCVFALFLIFLSFFHLFCWLGSFVLFLFLNVLVSFLFFLFSFLCVWCFIFAVFESFRQKLHISCLCVRFLFAKFVFCQVSFSWMLLFQTQYFLFSYLFATLCVQSLLLAFPFFQSVLLFHLFHSLVLLLFLPFLDVLFIPKNKKV